MVNLDDVIDRALEKDGDRVLRLLIAGVAYGQVKLIEEEGAAPHVDLKSAKEFLFKIPTVRAMAEECCAEFEAALEEIPDA